MKNFYLLSILLFLATGAVSCSHHSELDTPIDETEDISVPTRLTLFMYMPWSDLYTSLNRNMDDMLAALSQEKLPGKKVVAFISKSPYEAEMYELTGGKKKLLKTYTSPALTSPQGIASIILDVKEFAPASQYAMTIGCHGTGWLPIGSLDQPNKYTLAYQQYKIKDPATRFFGALTPDFQVETSTLVSALEESSTHLDFLVFDACYMGCVEVAYQLRDVTDITMLSPSEIMGIGLPYQQIGALLLHDQVNWQSICTKFHEFFSSYLYPYGTISVIDSHKLPLLADAMRQLNAEYQWDYSHTEELQSFGGFYRENIFFDLGQYAKRLSNGNNSEFQSILQQTVIAATHTPRCYVASNGTLPINHYSGLSCSAPSTSPFTASWLETQWAIDTKSRAD